MARSSRTKILYRGDRLALAGLPFTGADSPGPSSPRNCSRGITVSGIKPDFATLGVASKRRTPNKVKARNAKSEKELAEEKKPHSKRFS